MIDRPLLALSADVFNSLLDASKGDAQREIPQSHCELDYAVRQLGELGLTASSLRRLAIGK
jgi:hypothetical protein